MHPVRIFPIFQDQLSGNGPASEPRVVFSLKASKNDASAVFAVLTVDVAESDLDKLGVSASSYSIGTVYLIGSVDPNWSPKLAMVTNSSTSVSSVGTLWRYDLSELPAYAAGAMLLGTPLKAGGKQDIAGAPPGKIRFLASVQAATGLPFLAHEFDDGTCKLKELQAKSKFDIDDASAKFQQCTKDLAKAKKYIESTTGGGCVFTCFTDVPSFPFVPPLLFGPDIGQCPTASSLPAALFPGALIDGLLLPSYAIVVEMALGEAALLSDVTVHIDVIGYS